MFTKFSCMLPIAIARSCSGGVTQSQGERAMLGLFFPIDNALHSIIFGTHANTAEPIEVPFGLMTRVLPRYHVLDGGPDPQAEAIYGENLAAHCRVMVHSVVCCAKTAERIDMLFWMKTWVGPRNHVLDGGADPQGEGAIFRGLFRPFKSIGNLHYSCRCHAHCNRDHSVANNGMQQTGSFSMLGMCK